MYVLLLSEIVKVFGDYCSSASLITCMSEVFVQVICPEMGVNRTLYYLQLAGRVSHVLARGADQIRLTN